MSDAKLFYFHEVAEFKKGINYTSKDYCELGTGIPFVSIKCLEKGGGLDLSGIKYVTDRFKEEDKLNEGDLLFSVTDLTRDGDIVGSPLIITRKIRGSVASMDMMRVITNKDLVDNTYLFYLMMTKECRSYFVNHSSGSTVLHLEISSIPQLRLKLPYINTQRKIARILLSIDGQIENTEAIIAKYQAVKQSMLQDLFTRGIDANTGQLRPSYEDAPDLYKDSPLGMIPEEWCYTTIGDVLTLQRGIDITSKDFVKGSVPVYSSSGLQGYHNKSIANGPGVITGRKGTLGKVYYSDLPYWPHDTTLWVKDFKGNNAKFIYYFLQDMDLSKHDEATANPTLNRNNVHPLKIIFPMQYEEQVLIAKSISSHVDRINIEIKSLSKLQLLKQGLMQDLLSGEVVVTA